MSFTLINEKMNEYKLKQQQELQELQVIGKELMNISMQYAELIATFKHKLINIVVDTISPEEKIGLIRTAILNFQLTCVNDDLNVANPNLKDEINKARLQINQLLVEELSFKDKIADIIRDTTILQIYKIEQIANILM